MEFKYVSKSSKGYTFFIVIALILLVFTTFLTFRQIKLTQTSGDKLVHALQYYNLIGQLTNHYTKAESSDFRQSLIGDAYAKGGLETYKLEGKAVIDSLKVLTVNDDVTTSHLQVVNALFNKLYVQIANLKTETKLDKPEELQTVSTHGLKIELTINEIRTAINSMLVDQDNLMNVKTATYTFHKSLTPKVLLVLAVFALILFILSFFRLYYNKLKIRKSEILLKTVLTNTNNIVNYYEPIFNAHDAIIDFKIVFANDRNLDYFGFKPSEITGKPISSVFTFLQDNGELEKLISCYTNRNRMVFDREIVIDNNTYWFHSIITPLEKGILVTARNSTAEEEAKITEQKFKEQLQKRNLQLLESRAFLTNVFQSISHLVIHFKSIRNEIGDIIDFEILFINENVNPITREETGNLHNKKLSEVNEKLFKSKVFNHLVAAVTHNKKEDFQVFFKENGQPVWLQAAAVKLEDGVTLTTRDITKEKEKEQEILRINEELSTKNTIFKDAEKVAEIGSYIWYLDNGEAIISDNYYRILGCKDTTIDITFDNYRGFVHKDDLNKYDRLGIQTQEQGYSDINEYRIVTKQGETKYLRLKGQSVQKNGRPASLGVVQDVTEKKARELEMSVLNEQLLIQNSILNDAEHMAKIGSFIWYVDHDLSEISDNLYRMLGYEPKDSRVSFKAFRSFIHPDDLASYDEKGEEIIRKKQITEYTYRVITKQGAIKHFKSNGQFIKKEGRKVVVGVIQDFTEVLKVEAELKQSNLDLQRSNTELESFNRIASHDLQEPLRKIQMFISRIKDEEGAQFSDKSLQYFKKVTNASKRMQSLIQNLLTYSRIENQDKDIESVDLNEVLDKVTEDLLTVITESEAKITSDKLPVVSGIGFQMEQLFANLISNAIRYKKETEVPYIQITYTRVSANSIVSYAMGTHKSLHKISFIDNGIGFKPEYSDKIFEVFQRLHHDKTYSGTGIGLAICKKIVETHGGIIEAQSKEGEGAQFNVYFPC